MFLAVEKAFENSAKKLKLARFLISSGISISGNKMVVNGVSVSLSSVSSKLGIDRKTIYSFMSDVRRNFVLRSIFSKLSAEGDYSRISPDIGYEVIIFKSFPQDAVKFVHSISKLADVIFFSYTGGRGYVAYEPSVPSSDIKRLVAGLRYAKVYTPDVDKKGLICDKCDIEFCPRKRMMLR